jgi:hypothetical protein
MLDSIELMIHVETGCGAIRDLRDELVAGHEVLSILGDLVDEGTLDIRLRLGKNCTDMDLLTAADNGGDAGVVTTMLGIAGQLR